MNPMRPDHPWSATGFQLNEQAKRKRLQVEMVDSSATRDTSRSAHVYGFDCIL
jgi:hypothetical protein